MCVCVCVCSFHGFWISLAVSLYVLEWFRISLIVIFSLGVCECVLRYFGVCIYINLCMIVSICVCVIHVLFNFWIKFINKFLFSYLN